MPEIKTDVESIKARIKEGHYQSLSSALKAIGRVNGWKDKERDEVREYANKHFGGSGAKAAPKKAAGAKKGKHRAPRDIPAQPAAKATKATKEAAPKQAAGKKGRRRAEASEETSSVDKTMNEFNRVDTAVGIVEKATAGLKNTKDLGADGAYVSDRARAFAEAFSKCVDKVVAVLNGTDNQTAQQQMTAQQQQTLQKVASTVGINGASPPETTQAAPTIAYTPQV